MMLEELADARGHAHAQHVEVAPSPAVPVETVVAAPVETQPQVVPA
jgi:hypothetical protein